MKIAVVAATGPTGKEFVKLALETGHSVVACIRNPAKLPPDFKDNEAFNYVEVDIFSADSLTKAFDGVDAVASCLGYPGLKPPFTEMHFYKESCQAILEAMIRNEIRRLVAVTSWCTEYHPSHPKWLEWFFKPLAIGRHLSDMRRMELYLDEKRVDVDYTCVRPPGLSNALSSGQEIKSVEGQWVKENTTSTIPRADVARFMLYDCLGSDRWNNKCVAISL